MGSYKIQNLSFTYPKREIKAIDNISLNISRGEFITLCGKSGCGKTTLLRLLKPAISPVGTTHGDIYFDEGALDSLSKREQALKIGFVMQSPDNQIVCDKVWHELAFGLESLGFSASEIRSRVAEMASFFGIENWFYKKVTELSGGQKQLLNLASVMVMQPSVLILDEPTSQLDPIAASEFLKTLEKVNRELGTTIILSEHRLEEAIPMSDRIIVMDSGKIIADGSPNEVCKILKENNHHMYQALPTPMRVYGAVEKGTECPVTVRGGRQWLEGFAKENSLPLERIPKDTPYTDGEAIIELKDARFRYEKDLPDVIKGLSLKVSKGELFAILGGNGTGKTTMLSLISGISAPYRGKVLIHGREISKTENIYNGVLGVLPQNPQTLFAKKTVYADLLEMLSETKISKEEKEEQVREVSVLCRIGGLLESHPYDLSGGEQQRAALAKILLMSPEILLLDEPTKGFDAHFKEVFADILESLKAKGVTILMVSHDIEFCAKYADRCALVFDGSIISQGTPGEFFSGKSFYTTSANRMARTTIPNAVLAEDIIKACGGEAVERKREDVKDIKLPQRDKKERAAEDDSKKLPKKTLAAILSMLILVPLTICFGVYYLDDKKYYFISLLIILETLVPYCMAFESRKPQARELVVISVLCAIAVAGRCAFSMVPQLKPVLALIIISAACFGGEAGFLIGAVTGFVSNFFLGQGPWTPWQMFAFGTVGFLAGVLFKNGLLKRKIIPLVIFGFLATVIIYGGIMNPASIIMMQQAPTAEMIISAYAMGLPFDLMHGASTAFFLLFISKPMIDKLERIKYKYGLSDKQNKRL